MRTIITACLCFLPSGWLCGSLPGDPAGEGSREGAPPSLVTPVGILPGYKTGLSVEKEERNPFGVIVERAPVVEKQGEAAKLTQILEKLPFAGLSRGEDGDVRSVLLGDIRFVRGQRLPPVMESQTDELVVESVSGEEVVVAWTKEAGREVSDKRQLTLRFDSRPRVQVMLPGQGWESGTKIKTTRKTVFVTPGGALFKPEEILPTAGLPAGGN